MHALKQPNHHVLPRDQVRLILEVIRRELAVARAPIIRLEPADHDVLGRPTELPPMSKPALLQEAETILGL